MLVYQRVIPQQKNNFSHHGTWDIYGYLRDWSRFLALRHQQMLPYWKPMWDWSFSNPPPKVSMHREELHRDEQKTYWLVVSIPLINISQVGSSSQLLGKIKNVPNHRTEKLRIDKVHGPSWTVVDPQGPVLYPLHPQCRWRCDLWLRSAMFFSTQPAMQGHRLQISGQQKWLQVWQIRCRLCPNPFQHSKQIAFWSDFPQKSK